MRPRANREEKRRSVYYELNLAQGGLRLGF